MDADAIDVATIARLALAAILFPHGAQHALGWFGGHGFAGTHAWMTGTLGFPAALAALAIVVELASPLVLLLGLASRPSLPKSHAGAHGMGAVGMRLGVSRATRTRAWRGPAHPAATSRTAWTGRRRRRGPNDRCLRRARGRGAPARAGGSAGATSRAAA